MTVNDLTRRSALAAAAGCAASPGATPAAVAGGGGGAWAAIDRMAEAMINARLSPGLSLAVMFADKLVYARGFGSANLETETPMTQRSVLRIGSITKQFTAAAVLRLVEQGKLALTDPLNRYIPEIPGGSSVNLQQLLTHTSGLNTYTDGDFLQDSRRDETREAMLARFARLKPLYAFGPGHGWAYSDTGYFLLGVIVERVSGLSLADYLRSHVIEPAGLAETAIDDDAVVVRHRASGYSGDRKAASGFANASYTSMSYAGGAGSMRATPADLCLWHRALLGGRVLRHQSLISMLHPVQLANGSDPTWPMGVTNGLGGKPVRYGFGHFLDDVDGRPAIAHGGYIQGFLSWIGTFPKERFTLAYTVNCDDRRGELQAKLDALRVQIVRMFAD